MNFTVANHNDAHNPSQFIHYDTVEFSDIPQMVTSGYCYCACKLVDNYRVDNNFDGSVDVLIIDIDDSCTIEQSKVLFKKYEYFLVTSKSHQIDKGGLTCDRFRLFFNLNKTIYIREEIEAVYSQFIEKYPFIDKKCRNVSRFFYSSPSSAEVFYNEGREYKVKIVNSVHSARVEGTNDHQPMSEVKYNDVYCFNELTDKWENKHGDVLELENNNKEENNLKGIKKFLDDEFHQGNKGHCLFNASCMMVKDGFGEDFIVDHLIKEWEARGSSTDKFKDALQNIKGGLKYN